MTRNRLVALTWLALLTPAAAAPVPALAPKGDPPGLFLVTEVSQDTIVLKGSGSTTYTNAIKDLDIYDGAGKKLTAEDLLKRVKAGSVVVVAADENAVDPAYLRPLKDDAVVLVGVVEPLARAERMARGWTADLKKMKAGENPVAGKILGADFKPQIQLLNTGLSLRSGQDMIHMFLFLKPGEGIAGKTIQVSPQDQAGQGVPAVHVHIHSTKPFGVQAYTSGYALRLEFGPEKDGVIPGKIYLCLPDDRKSWVAGSFTVTIR
jgi:hypothetical protein